MTYSKILLKDYLNSLGVSSAVPGGGSASALTGAMGAALGKMVTGILFNKAKPNHKVKIKQYQKKFSLDYLTLLRLSEKDSEAYDGVLKAYTLPKRTSPEISRRRKKIQSALYQAILVPLKAMQISLDNLICFHKIAPLFKPNQNLKSDFSVAVSLSQTAIKGCLMNVNINLLSIKVHSLKTKTIRQIRLLNHKMNIISKKLDNFIC